MGVVEGQANHHGFNLFYTHQYCVLVCDKEHLHRDRKRMVVKIRGVCYVLPYLPPANVVVLA